MQEFKKFFFFILARNEILSKTQFQGRGISQAALSTDGIEHQAEPIIKYRSKQLNLKLYFWLLNHDCFFFFVFLFTMKRRVFNWIRIDDNREFIRPFYSSRAWNSLPFAFLSHGVVSLPYSWEFLNIFHLCFVLKFYYSFEILISINNFIK